VPSCFCPEFLRSISFSPRKRSFISHPFVGVLGRRWKWSRSHCLKQGSFVFVRCGESSFLPLPGRLLEVFFYVVPAPYFGLMEVRLLPARHGRLHVGSSTDLFLRLFFPCFCVQGTWRLLSLTLPAEEPNAALPRAGVRDELSFASFHPAPFVLPHESVCSQSTCMTKRRVRTRCCSIP